MILRAGKSTLASGPMVMLNQRVMAVTTLATTAAIL